MEENKSVLRVLGFIITVGLLGYAAVTMKSAIVEGGQEVDKFRVALCVFWLWVFVAKFISSCTKKKKILLGYLFTALAWSSVVILGVFGPIALLMYMVK